MRRLLAILLLLLSATSSAAAVACPMGVAAAPASASGFALAEASNHDHEGPTSHESHRSDADCRLVMICAGAVPVPAAGHAERVAACTTASRSAADPVRWSTVFLSNEPPPPRLSA